MIDVINHRVASVAETIYQLQQASYAWERDLIEYAAPVFPPLKVSPEEIRQSNEHFIGCWQSNELAGVLSFATSPQQIEIGRLVVHPKYFRRGIATRLLKAVEAQVTDGQSLVVSTAEKNVPAVHLYEKLGYRVVSRNSLSNGIVLVHFLKHLKGQMDE